MIPLTGLSTPSKKGTLMSQTTPSTAGPLTVVLVQGAFADASSWTGVIERLQAGGVQGTAPANPLRGLSSDSAYLASVFAQISDPPVNTTHQYTGWAVIKGESYSVKRGGKEENEYKFARANGNRRRLSADRRRAALERTWHQTPGAA